MYSTPPQTQATSYEELPPIAKRRFFMNVGFTAGGGDVGTQGFSAAGAQVTAGFILAPRLHLQGEWTYLGLTSYGNDGATVMSASQHRVGGSVRYVWWRAGKGDVGHADMALEAGLGRTFLEYSGGGLLERNDVMFGVSSMNMFNVSSGSVTRPAFFGLEWGLRVHLSPMPEQAYLPYTPGPITCPGPCTAPGASLGVDTTVLFQVGFTYGK
jgi:hypothetical protein